MSQRILLHSLTLADHDDPGPPTYGAAWALLEKSPQIAAYIRCLNVELPKPNGTRGDAQGLQQVLGKLKNIRRCTISGAPSSKSFKWDNVAPGLRLALHSFLSRQSLQQLNVLSIKKIPLAVFIQVLGIAPSLCFRHMSVSVGDGQISAVTAPQSSTPEHLTLEIAAHGICKLLARPQFAPFMANLRELNIMPQYARSSSTSLIRSAASTLNYLHLNFMGAFIRCLPCILFSP
jgi:hypothetical protein